MLLVLWEPGLLFGQALWFEARYLETLEVRCLESLTDEIQNCSAVLIACHVNTISFK